MEHDAQYLVNIGQIIFHPDYNSGDLNNNLAILRINKNIERIEYRYNIAPVALPNIDVTNRDFHILVSAGWNMTNVIITTIDSILIFFLIFFKIIHFIDKRKDSETNGQQSSGFEIFINSSSFHSKSHKL